MAKKWFKALFKGAQAAAPVDVSLDGEFDAVNDVKVNNVSVLDENGVANIAVPACNVPPVPTENGSYKLVIADGVASWETIA